MVAPQKREIRDSIELEKIRAGNQKKVAYHQVCCPGAEQVRQAVENVMGFQPFLRDYIVHLLGKCLESACRIEPVNRHSRLIFNERLVICEPHINDFSSVFQGLCDIRPDELLKIVDAVHLPDDVVAFFQAA